MADQQTQDRIIEDLVQESVRDFEKKHPGVELDEAAIDGIRNATREAFEKAGVDAREMGDFRVSLIEGAGYGVDGAVIAGASRSGLSGLAGGTVGRIAVPLTLAFGAYDTYSAYREGDRVGVGRAVGGTVGGLGAAIGTGVLVGSWAGPIGWAAGAAAGAGGYFIGRWLGGKVAEKTAPAESSMAQEMRMLEISIDRREPAAVATSQVSEPQREAEPGAGPDDLYEQAPRGELAARFAPHSEGVSMQVAGEVEPGTSVPKPDALKLKV